MGTSWGSLRTDPCYGMPEGAPRARLRTDSCFGMPVSPWPENNEGLASQLTKAAQLGVPVMSAAWPVNSGYVHTQTPVLPMDCWQSPAAPPGVFVSSTSSGPSRPSTTSCGARTTVMFRNLPERFTRADLLHLLDCYGFRGRYDFVYLPFNFDTLANLRHAFVNMVTPDDVENLWEEFDGFSDWSVPNECVCALAWNEKQQGLPALVERYRNSPVMHEKVPDHCKPLILNEGKELTFPAPTQVIKAPKLRKRV